jgi:hypothetical protein
LLQRENDLKQREDNLSMERQKAEKMMCKSTIIGEHFEKEVQQYLESTLPFCTITLTARTPHSCDVSITFPGFYPITILIEVKYRTKLAMIPESEISKFRHDLEDQQHLVHGGIFYTNAKIPVQHQKIVGKEAIVSGSFSDLLERIMDMYAHLVPIVREGKSQRRCDDDAIVLDFLQSVGRVYEQDIEFIFSCSKYLGKRKLSVDDMLIKMDNAQIAKPHMFDCSIKQRLSLHHTRQSKPIKRKQPDKVKVINHKPKAPQIPSISTFNCDLKTQPLTTELNFDFDAMSSLCSRMYDKWYPSVFDLKNPTCDCEKAANLVVYDDRYAFSCAICGFFWFQDDFLSIVKIKYCD